MEHRSRQILERVRTPRNPPSSSQRSPSSQIFTYYFQAIPACALGIPRKRAFRPLSPVFARPRFSPSFSSRPRDDRPYSDGNGKTYTSSCSPAPSHYPSSSAPRDTISSRCPPSPISRTCQSILVPSGRPAPVTHLSTSPSGRSHAHGAQCPPRHARRHTPSDDRHLDGVPG